MDNNYYIIDNEEQKGPFTFKELTDYGPDLRSRILSPLAEGWQDACDLPELYPYFESLGVYLPTGDNLASFGRRLAAFIVDVIILEIFMQYLFVFLASRGINFNIPTYEQMSKLPLDQVMHKMMVPQLIWNAILITYYTVCEASGMKASFGKRLFKLVVVDIDGIGLSWINSLIRSFGKAISITILYTGFLSIFFTEHKQALHDYLAKTYVVKRD